MHHFIALVQVAVYAGAIMVLFLFVIMLLGAEKLTKSPNLPWQRPVAIGLGLILIIEGIYVIFFRANPSGAFAEMPAGAGSTEMIGEMLFSQYLLPFEIVSVLLLVAMIGAIVFTEKGGLKRR